MNATINFELRENKKDATGNCPIYLRITYDRKPAWMSLGISVKPKEWNKEKQRVRRNHDRNVKLNDYLEKVKSSAQDAIIELKEKNKLSSKRVIAIVKGIDHKEFFTYAELYIKDLLDQGSVRRAKNAKVIMNKIRDYVGSESLSLHEIDHEFLNGLKHHLQVEFENKPNTIRKNFQRLSHLLKTAKKAGHISENPFTDYKLPAYQKPKKDSLSYEQIKAIIDAELEPETPVWHARNFFLFSFYNAGIRFGDLCKLQKRNIEDGRLKYLMGKTASNSEPKWKNINLLLEAIEILERYNYRDKEPKDYLFPIVDPDKDLSNPIVFDREKQSKNALTNKNLKKLAAIAGIDQSLSTHIARHSFANYALKKGMSLYSISKALAHSDLKTTQTYLKAFDEKLLDQEMQNLFTE